VALCILCHNPGLTVNGVSFDFKVMVHKIHMGEKLPGNVAAIALGGSGFSIGSTNYAEAAYPFMSRDSQVSATPIECTKCHRVGRDINGRAFGTDVDKWKGTAKIENCITCHDTTAFNVGQTTSGINVANADLVAGEYTPKLTSVTAVPHTGGLIWTDAVCRACHVSELAGDNAYKMSIVGHHTVFEKSPLFTGLNFQILSVTNATPGNMPTVTFKITDNSGNPLSPAETGSSYSLKLGYFTLVDYANDGMGDYGQPLSQALAGAAANQDGSYAITFSSAIPAIATGTGVIGMEGRRTYNIPATDKYAARTVRAGGKSVQYYFNLATGIQVTDPARQRRVSVDTEKCNACHSRLTLHGGNRTNDVQQCIICHNPNSTDRDQHSTTAGDGLTEQSVHFKVMIHKIHTGASLDVSAKDASGNRVGYYVANDDFSKVKYPRDRRDCLACHVDSADLGLPLPAGLLGTTTATGEDKNNAAKDDNSRMPPIAATCLSCHDTGFAANHAAGHITGSGASATEGCVACHKTGLLQGLDFAHKPVR
jgi:OmcA/MtrC family decaheme c-type cytochrome